MVIPPAWSNVRISPKAGGKVQAVGLDVRGRVQYIYNQKFAESRQRKKFARIEQFGRYLPQLHAVTNKHILLEGFPREKVLALMTRLINSLYIRMGTDKSVKEYRTYGITTLGKRHIKFGSKGRVIFDFVGKSRIKHKKVLVDPDLALLLRQLTELGGGRKLFQYQDEENKIRPVRPAEINRYIKALTSEEYSAKDFRTWGASVLMAIELAEIGVAENDGEAKRNIVNAVRRVAAELGNTPTVCRASYIHPVVIKAYGRGVTIDAFIARRQKPARRIESETDPAETALLKLFQEFR
jgi:DNA topoisomerase I